MNNEKIGELSQDNKTPTSLPIFTEEDLDNCWAHHKSYLVDILNGDYSLEAARDDLGGLIGSEFDRRFKDKPISRPLCPEEEIKKQAREFVDEWFGNLGWEKQCDVCKEINCKSNGNCIRCGCQL